MNGYGGGEKEKSDVNISYTLAFYARVLPAKCVSEPF